MNSSFLEIVNSSCAPASVDSTDASTICAEQNPSATAPAATDPVATVPAATDPAATDPAATDLAATDSSSKSAGQITRIDYLDGLRAVAILSVLTFHSAGPIGASIMKRGGWVGVDIFFVLSGFLITGILLKERVKTNTISLKHFYLRRALRLTPVYILFLLVTCFTGEHSCPNIFAALGIAAIYMVDYDVALGWGNIAGSGLEIAWSLSVEEKFYLLWPTLMKRFKDNLGKIVVAIICGCYLWKVFLVFQTTGPLAYSNYLGHGAAFDTKADEIMLGCLAALMLASDKVRGRMQRILGHSWMPVALAVGLFVAMRGMPIPEAAHTLAQRLLFWNFKLPLFCVAFAALLISLSLNPHGIMAKILSLPPFPWIGRISYSLYLWHGIAFISTVIFVFHNTMFISPAFMEVANYAAAIALAALSYYVVEQPFLKLKDRIGH